MSTAAISPLPTSPLADTSTTLADGLRDERTLRAWSQQHLADAAGVSLRTVQRAERGDPVAGETLLALAAALDIDVQALVVARQRAVAAAAAVPPVADPYRRLRFDPERIGWLGVLLALPVLWFVVGAVVYLATGWTGLLPPGVVTSGGAPHLSSDFGSGFHVGVTGAALLANAAAVLVRRDTRLNLAVAAVLIAALAALLALG